MSESFKRSIHWFLHSERKTLEGGGNPPPPLSLVFIKLEDWNFICSLTYSRNFCLKTAWNGLNSKLGQKNTLIKKKRLGAFLRTYFKSKATFSYPTIIQNTYINFMYINVTIIFRTACPQTGPSESGARGWIVLLGSRRSPWTWSWRKSSRRRRQEEGKFFCQCAWMKCLSENS